MEEVKVENSEVKEEVKDESVQKADNSDISSEVKSESKDRDSKSKSIPYERFSQVIAEKNALKSKIDELESRFKHIEESKRESSDMDYKDFLDAGYEPEVAKTLAKLFDSRAERMMKNRFSDIEKKMMSYDLDSTVKSFAENHTDFKELEPKMVELFNGLEPEVQGAFAKNKKAIDILYKAAKAESIDKVYEKGKEDAIKKEKSKMEGGSFDGSSSSKIDNIELKEDMSMEDYMKIRGKALSMTNKAIKNVIGG